MCRRFLLLFIAGILLILSSESWACDEQEWTLFAPLQRKKSQAEFDVDPNLPEKRALLSFDGDRPIIPAYMLRVIEILAEKPISSLFNYFAGTAEGGVLALVTTISDEKKENQVKLPLSKWLKLLYYQDERIFKDPSLFHEILQTYFGKEGPKIIDHKLILLPAYIPQSSRELMLSIGKGKEIIKENSACLLAKAICAKPDSLASVTFDDEKIDLMNNSLLALNPAEDAMKYLKTEVLRNKQNVQLTIYSIGSGLQPPTSQGRNPEQVAEGLNNLKGETLSGKEGGSFELIDHHRTSGPDLSKQLAQSIEVNNSLFEATQRYMKSASFINFCNLIIPQEKVSKDKISEAIKRINQELNQIDDQDLSPWEAINFFIDYSKKFSQCKVEPEDYFSTRLSPIPKENKNANLFPKEDHDKNEGDYLHFTLKTDKNEDQNNVSHYLAHLEWLRNALRHLDDFKQRETGLLTRINFFKQDYFNKAAQQLLQLEKKIRDIVISSLNPNLPYRDIRQFIFRFSGMDVKENPNEDDYKSLLFRFNNALEKEGFLEKQLCIPGINQHNNFVNIVGKWSGEMSKIHEKVVINEKTLLNVSVNFITNLYWKNEEQSDAFSNQLLKIQSYSRQGWH